jgi:hypothetical protein
MQTPIIKNIEKYDTIVKKKAIPVTGLGGL